MARISPTLRNLLDCGAVVFCSTDAKKMESYKRREPLKWLLRQSDGSTVAVTTTIERMSQRAGSGLSFDARAMKKVARGVTQVHLAAASAAAAGVITIFDVTLPLAKPIKFRKSEKVQFTLKLRSKEDVAAYDQIRSRLITKGNPLVPVQHPALVAEGITSILFTSRGSSVRQSVGGMRVELVNLEGYNQKYVALWNTALSTTATTVPTAEAAPLTAEQVAYTKKVIADSGSSAVVPKPPTVTDHITLFDVRLPLLGSIEVQPDSLVRFSLRLSSKEDLAAFDKIKDRVISAEVPVAHPIFTVRGIKTVLFIRRLALRQVAPGVFATELTGYAQKASAPKSAPKRKTAAAVKAATAKDSAAAKIVPPSDKIGTFAARYMQPGSKLKEAAATTPLKDATSPRAHVIFLVDRSSSMDLDRRTVFAEQQIKTIVAALAPDYLIDVYDFSWETKLQQLQRPAKDFKLSTPANSGTTVLYVALDKGLTSALGYVQTGASVLLYLLTDGENNGPFIDVSAKVQQLLATDKATIAAIGPKSALQFLTKQGVPEGCLLDWQGSGDALKAATVKAAAGAKAFTDAVKQKKSSSLKTFFVDVVATSLTIAVLKRELRDITTSLLRRKLAKYEVCKPFVVDSLKKDYVPGAAYYQLVKKEELKAGRRIIIQPRDEDCFYAGPKARQLLGLPSDGDVTIEPKNLGDFIVYVQSAAENRKLLPGTLFLYDLSHVDGATAPTWSK